MRLEMPCELHVENIMIGWTYSAPRILRYKTKGSTTRFKNVSHFSEQLIDGAMSSILKDDISVRKGNVYCFFSIKHNFSMIVMY